MSGSANRLGARDLVRWNDDIDKGLMLTIQYVCGEAGVRIPWHRVAEVMGPKFSEGSITQHLAKLRKRMAGANIPVPPTLKRGYISKTPSKVYNNTNGQYQFDPILPLYADTPKVEESSGSLYTTTPRTPAGAGASDIEEPTPTKSAASRAATRARVNTRGSAKSSAKSKSKGKGRLRLGAMSDDDEEDGPMPELYDESDEDYGAPPRKLMSAKKTTPLKRKNNTVARVKVEETGSPSQTLPALPGSPCEPLTKDEEAEVALDGHISPSGPARNTRGVKRDYTMMGDTDDSNNGVSDAEPFTGNGTGDGNEESDRGLGQGGATIQNSIETGFEQAITPAVQDNLATPFQDDGFQQLTAWNFANTNMTNMSDNAPLNPSNLFNTGDPFSAGNMFNSGPQNMQWVTMPDGTAVFMPNVNPYQHFQHGYGNTYASGLHQTYQQPTTFPGPFDAGMPPPSVNRPHTNSIATEFSGMTMGSVSRDSSVSGGTTGFGVLGAISPPRLLPTMQEAAAEDFGDAADTEQTFAMDNLFDPNMFGEAEHEL